MCGSAEIEGYAFCFGLDSLGTALEESMIQVTFLIRETIFRSRVTPRDQDRLSLNICSLGELIPIQWTATVGHRSRGPPKRDMKPSSSCCLRPRPTST